MGRALAAKSPFSRTEAAQFRLYVLAGCRRLDAEELHLLANEIHQSAHERQSLKLGVKAYVHAADSLADVPDEHRSWAV
jgi:hypothetical protein